MTNDQLVVGTWTLIGHSGLFIGHPRRRDILHFHMSPTPPRAILHVDLDAFFAAVEQLDDPTCRGKPVLVGHDGSRGVVSAASYEARVFGCRSAQPMIVAKGLCPHAIVKPVRFERYHELSSAMFAILETFTPLVQPLSIDEAFLDVTGSVRLFGAPEKIATDIRQRVREELGITCSVGVAPNKFLAKLASDLNKPDGLTIIRADEIEPTLSPLPINRIWGIGPKTTSRLNDLGVKTIGDLKKLSPEFLQKRFGIEAERYLRLSVGDDVRDVTPDHQAKSIGQERTFGIDLIEPDHVRGALLHHVEQVARRLRRHNFKARGVTVKIRDGEFHTVTRSAVLEQPTDVTDELWKTTRHLFDTWAAASFRPIRLIGMQATRLQVGPDEPGLFQDPAHERHSKLDRAVDRIQSKFGSNSIARATSRRARRRDGLDEE
jgi:DNA polymerase-4